MKSEQEEQLWQKIKHFSLDDPEVEFSFTDRLCRENDWPLDYAVRVVHEYKKFMFLICFSNHPLTPSDQVDQVWHLHLIYTENYWIDWCQNTLGRKIQHGPTKGGGQEKMKYGDWYSKTKERYKETFGENPPKDIWPENKIRFGQLNFTRVNRHTNWVIPKPAFLRRWIS